MTLMLEYYEPKPLPPLERWQAQKKTVRKRGNNIQLQFAGAGAKDDLIQAKWMELNGHELEDCLESGAIALLDAEWLVDYAYQCGSNAENDNPENNDRDDPVLPCRQELPPEAFLSLSRIREATGDYHIHIIAISYMWLSLSHPDPKGTTLRLIARRCMEYLFDADRVRDGLEVFCWGIFWDWASLYQHPDITKGIRRSPEEQSLFVQGLNTMMTLYSHPHTHCWKVTKFPSDFPEGYNTESDVNPPANYNDRGWPFVESLLTSMTKAFEMTRMICNDETRSEENADSAQFAPTTPDRVAERLQHVHFSNGKSDKPLVLRLYKEEFERVFGRSQRLSYSDMGWGDSQIDRVSQVIAHGYTPNLQVLDFGATYRRNQIGTPGCRAIARALLSDKAPQGLRTLYMTRNESVDDEGVRALSKGVVKLQHVSFSSCSIGDRGCEHLSREASLLPQTTPSPLKILKLNWNKGVSAQGCQYINQLLASCHHMEELYLCGTSIGDEGVCAIAEMVMKRLTIVELRDCGMGDLGCQGLAEAAELCNNTSSEPPLSTLNLSQNKNMTVDGSLLSLVQIAKNCPLLRGIHLDRNLQQAGVEERLQAASGKSRFFCSFEAISGGE